MSLVSLFESNPLTAYPILILLLLVLLFLARHQAHRMVRSCTRIASQALRLASKSLLIAEAKLRQRNREVLLAAGAGEIEKELEREFQRVDAVVKRDLQTYPPSTAACPT